jgi:hypothetical protein
MKAIGRLFAGLFRLILLPFKLVGRLTAVLLKVVLKLGLLPFKLGRATARLMTFRGILLGAVGVAAGLLLAPMTGRQLREKLMAMLAGGGAVPDDELAEKVSFELSHAPRTWHLEPQPDVSVIAGRVVLSGQVRTDDARSEFARVAAAVPGVVAVDNQLEVTDGAGGPADEPAAAAATAATEPAATPAGDAAGE